MRMTPSLHVHSVSMLIISLISVWHEDSAYLASQAREALNFQITILLAYLVSWILAVILIGFVLMGIIWLANIILSILAAVAASKGEDYQYPFTLRLIN